MFDLHIDSRCLHTHSHIQISQVTKNRVWKNCKKQTLNTLQLQWATVHPQASSNRTWSQLTLQRTKGEMVKAALADHSLEPEQVHIEPAGKAPARQTS